jgi:hypothetical protein
MPPWHMTCKDLECWNDTFISIFLCFRVCPFMSHDPCVTSAVEIFSLNKEQPKESKKCGHPQQNGLCANTRIHTGKLNSHAMAVTRMGTHTLFQSSLLQGVL